MRTPKNSITTPADLLALGRRINAAKPQSVAPYEIEAQGDECELCAGSGWRRVRGQEERDECKGCSSLGRLPLYTTDIQTVLEHLGVAALDPEDVAAWDLYLEASGACPESDPFSGRVALRAAILEAADRCEYAISVICDGLESEQIELLREIYERSLDGHQRHTCMGDVELPRELVDVDLCGCDAGTCYLLTSLGKELVRFEERRRTPPTCRAVCLDEGV